MEKFDHLLRLARDVAVIILTDSVELPGCKIRKKYLVSAAKAKSISLKKKISLPHACLPFQSAVFVVENKKSTQLKMVVPVYPGDLVKSSRVKVTSLPFICRDGCNCDSS